MSAVQSPVLHERDGELSELAATIDSAASGRGVVVLVTGPAGIGKTSLLDAAAGRATAAGLRVLRARGGALERDFAFGIVRGLFERAAAGQPLQGAAALARPVVDPRATPVVGSDEDAVRHGLYWLCADLAEQRPLALVVDDAHWSDAPSLRFLVYLARRIEELPLALLVAARPPEPADHGELLGALAAERAVRRLAPAPLSRGAVIALVRALAGPEVPDELGDACHAAAAGNPFLVTQALRGEPRTVATDVSQRLTSLAPGALGLARAIAVVPELYDARALAGIDDERAAELLDVLVAQDILCAAPLDFVHPLVRSAVYDGIPAGERSLLHLRAAERLAAADHSPEEIAPHLLATEPGGREWVSTLLHDAAHRALAADVAVTYLRRALAEPSPAVARAALLGDLGAAEVRLGRPEGIEHLRGGYAAARPGVDRARAGRALAWALVAPGRYEEATSALEDALAEADDRELALALEADLSIAGRLGATTTERSARRLDRFAGAIEGETPAERAILASLAMRRLMLGDDARGAAQLARRAFDRGLITEQGPDATAIYDVLFVLMVAEELELAEEAATVTIDEARTRGSLLGFARGSCFRAQARWRRGALADAEGDARACIDVAAERGWEVRHIGSAALCNVLVDRGRLHEAEAELAAAGGLADVPDTFMRNFVLHARARLRLAAGAGDGAIADLRELARREERWRGRNPSAFAHRSLLAHALLDRDETGAEELAAEEVALARRWGSPGAIAVALLALARAGRDPSPLTEAEALAAGSQTRLVHAQALVELGAAQRRDGQRRAAREPLATALDLATRCGAPPLAQRAREELLATGARPRRALRTGPDALTPSELRVARLAAEGLTNREIAQALFVTTRTVEVHLTHAYAKLGIPGRAELAGALAD